MDNQNRFLNIDFLKVFGCLCVVLYHMCSAKMGIYMHLNVPLYEILKDSCNLGYLAVDLFFIISGLFFALRTDFSKPLTDFLKRKIKRLYPVFILALSVSYILSLFKIVPFNIYNAIINILALNGTALAKFFGQYSEIHVFWYVSSMLWTFVLYYFLIQNLDKKWSNFFIAIIIFVSYSLLLSNSWTTSTPIFGIISSGLLRGFGGIGTGYFLGKVYKKIENYQFNNFYKAIFNLLEVLCIVFVISTLLFNNTHVSNNIIYVIIFSSTVLLFLLKKGFISNLLEAKIFGFLSKYTYPVFIVHGLIIHILHNTLWKTQQNYMINYPYTIFLLSLAFIVISGIVAYYVCEFIQNKIGKKQ